MKNLLIVSFYFPPIMSAASARIGKFAKYLPEYGWNPVILTVNPKEILAKGIPVEMDEGRIYRTSYHDPVGLLSRPPDRPRTHVNDSNPSQKATWKRNFREGLKKISPFTIQRMPDRMLGWYFYALKEARKILERENIDAIFSSHPPPVSHLVASKIHKKSGLPWVADYRDLWAGSTLRPYPMWLERLERGFEKKILRKVSAIITVSESLREYLVMLHQKPVEVIYNGFDPEDFEGFGDAEPPRKGVFTMVYSGTLYTSKQSPIPFFRALKNLKEKGIISKDNFLARFIGVQEPPFREQVEKYGLTSLITSEPFQPYRKNVAVLKGASALLFFSWNKGQMKGNPTSKIFQYAGAARTILIVGDQNPFVADFVKKSRTGVVCKDEEQISRVLKRWLKEFFRDGDVEYKPDISEIAPYNRKLQAGALSVLLNRFVS